MEDIKQYKILLIENDLGSANLIKNLLVAGKFPLDYELNEFSTIKEAVEYLRKNETDLIIFNSSFLKDSLHTIVNNAPDTPIVIITGNDNFETENNLLRNNNVIEVISKNWLNYNSLSNCILKHISDCENNNLFSDELIEKLSGVYFNPKILIVDDRPENLVALETLLEDLEVDIIKAGSGKEALAKVLKHDFALIVLDVQMPGMDGYETAELIRLREKSRNIPIIFLTANYKENSQVYKGYKKGAIDYIFKPIDNNILTAKVNAFLEMYKYRKKQEHLLIELKNIHMKLQDKNEKLSFLAKHDSLTLLNNRFSFDREFKRTFKSAQINDLNFVLLIIDIDDFKWINDKYGHSVGDEVIRQVGILLGNTVRQNDFIARIGGDEFAIIANIKRTGEAGVIAEKIFESFMRPITVSENLNINVNLSIGISEFTQTCKDFTTMFNQADIALYKAKNIGKNRFEFYSDVIKDLYENRKNIIVELKNAFINKEFSLNYQPIVNLSSRNIVGLETLLRWNNKKLGNVSPIKFIPIAEDIGIIHDIGKWVLEYACKQFAEWNQAGYTNLFYTVNLSPVQLKSHDFSKIFFDIFNKYNLDPSKVEVELTESALSSEYNELVENCVISLQKSKINVSIDDFGTGYSSLNRLGNLPINTLKIDASFFKDLNEKPRNCSIIKSILGLAVNLSMKVIAEGIENKYQYQFLLNNGCQMAQGFYFYKSMPANKITEILLEEKNKKNINKNSQLYDKHKSYKLNLFSINKIYLPLAKQKGYIEI